MYIKCMRESSWCETGSVREGAHLDAAEAGGGEDGPHDAHHAQDTHLGQGGLRTHHLRQAYYHQEEVQDVVPIPQVRSLVQDEPHRHHLRAKRHTVTLSHCHTVCSQPRQIRWVAKKHGKKQGWQIHWVAKRYG